jgi:hypothetical protein
VSIRGVQSHNPHRIGVVRAFPQQSRENPQVPQAQCCVFKHLSVEIRVRNQRQEVFSMEHAAKHGQDHTDFEIDINPMFGMIVLMVAIAIVLVAGTVVGYNMLLPTPPFTY